MLIIGFILLIGGIITEESAYGVGWLSGVIPSMNSFLIFRDRVLTLRRRI